MSIVTVVIAGIAGASLGTEIAKSLRAAGGYRVLGCDISPLAFGHYADVFEQTVVIDRSRYIEDVLEFCAREGAHVLIPGGEAPMRLISAAEARFRTAGVLVAANNAEVVARLGDKAACFAELARLGFAIPRTVPIHSTADVADIRSRA